MKKILIALSLSLLLFGCSSSSIPGVNTISADEVIKRIQKDDENSFLLVLTAKNCYSCDEYDKVVKELQNEKEFDIYMMDVDEQDKDKLDELKITLGEYATLPMTYYFDKGELKKDNVKANYIELEAYREWLKLLNMQ